ncbi:MAG: hypothetical protein A4E60_00155 [Syntrophorhabdus sp. PtaB.Bin047]|jgi:hypothetical protein|nr:MAG: hypothetical protein A4E60_00155 [Syntrophorhabdus sp. PtaB.Bin047]
MPIKAAIKDEETKKWCPYIEFGDGDIGLGTLRSRMDGEEALLFVFYPTEPVEVGTPLKDKPDDIDPAVIFRFTNTESLDVLINGLQAHRQILCKMKENEASKPESAQEV